MTKMLIVLATLAAGCGGSPASTPAAIQGTDFTGTYQIKDLECYNSALTTLTSSATFTGGFTETLTISGNSFTASTSNGTCTVVTTGTSIFSSSGLALNSYGVQSATGGGCSISITHTGTAITPATITTAFTSGQSYGNLSLSYIWVAPYVGIPAAYSDGAGGSCFLIFTKQ